MGSTLATGGIGSLILNHFGTLDDWLALVGGVILLLVILQNPDGIVGQLVHHPKDPLARYINKLVKNSDQRRRLSAEASLISLDNAKFETKDDRSAVLSVTGVTVRFGGVVALDDVTLTVRPGEVVGLIGPNGAGKTTLIDAITGYVRPTQGTVRLGELTLDGRPPHARARAGVSRSFQSLELFEDITVGENLLAASDRRDRAAYLTNLVKAGTSTLPPVAQAAVQEFQLQDALGRPPRDLPYGRRRLVGIARAVATNPRLLLLDEPAAGLGEYETSELGHLVQTLARQWELGILLVEHDIELVMSISDRIVVLDFGQKIAEGPPDVIRHDPAVVAAYLGEDSTDQPTPVSSERPDRESPTLQS
jgi:sulfate-transporting ATPase